MIEVLTKFDPYAMVNPKTDADIIALLDEAHRELDNLSRIMDDITRRCEQNRNKR